MIEILYDMILAEFNIAYYDACWDLLINQFKWTKWQIRTTESFFVVTVEHL
jgi:hypothetical protein